MASRVSPSSSPDEPRTFAQAGVNLWEGNEEIEREMVIKTNILQRLIKDGIPQDLAIDFAHSIKVTSLIDDGKTENDIFKAIFIDAAEEYEKKQKARLAQLAVNDSSSSDDDSDDTPMAPARQGKPIQRPPKSFTWSTEHILRSRAGRLARKQ